MKKLSAHLILLAFGALLASCGANNEQTNISNPSVGDSSVTAATSTTSETETKSSSSDAENIGGGYR